MVYYFTSNTVTPSAFIYVGKDKVENEELIKYGIEEDIWYLPFLSLCLKDITTNRDPRFHVDNLSSAHIYLRMNEGDSWDSVPADLLEDCAQLTKANSIDGNKKDNVTVIYTPWSNLKKDGSMAVGQVGFHNQKMVKRLHVAQRQNPIVNRLNKTKVERFPDLRQEKEDRLRELRNRDRAGQLSRQKEEKRVARENKEKAWQKEHAYDDIFTEEAMQATSNQDRGSDFEDDFM